MALQPSKLSDFRILASLGSGATARVFDAVHLASQRPVAIKMLAPANQEAMGELQERFAREALALSALFSRHIAQIVGFGFEQGQPFLVLERLQGETIDSFIKREGVVAPTQLAPWVAQLLVGVRDCHAHHVIHRDIKPANIFLQRTAGEPVVKLIDFGIARLTAVAHGGRPLTSTQHMLGSVGYMAPEQFESAKAVGPHTDLYAIAVVLFRCITGKLPFSGKSLDRVITAKLDEDPPAISSIVGAPRFASLDWFVTKGMARLPQARFQSAREMLDAWHDVMPLLQSEQTEALPSRVMARAPVPSAPAVPSVPSVHESVSAALASTQGAPTLADPTFQHQVSSEVALPSHSGLEFDGTDELPSLVVISVSEGIPRPSSRTNSSPNVEIVEAKPEESTTTKTYPHLNEIVRREQELSRQQPSPFDDLEPTTSPTERPPRG